MVLEKSSTQRVFRRVEKDSASLFVNRDADSILSRYTNKLSKLSIKFDFDGEPWVYPIYESFLRGAMKQNLRRLQADTASATRPQVFEQLVESGPANTTPLFGKHSHPSSNVDLTKVDSLSHVVVPRLSTREEREQKRRSQAIDQQLKEDSRRLRREGNVLVMGNSESGKQAIVEQMRIIHQNGYTENELVQYRLMIYGNLIDCVKAIIEAMRALNVGPEREANREHCEFLSNFTVSPDPKNLLGIKVGEAVASVWNDSCVPKLMERLSEFYLMDSAS
jgi:hypothetical protein